MAFVSAPFSHGASLIWFSAERLVSALALNSGLFFG